MRVLLTFSISSTVSMAVRMSIVTIKVRYEGFDALRLSHMCCARLVRSTVVECLALKPC